MNMEGQDVLYYIILFIVIDILMISAIIAYKFWQKKIDKIKNETISKKYNWLYTKESDHSCIKNIFVGNTDNINWKLTIKDLYKKHKSNISTIFETEINNKFLGNMIIGPKISKIPENIDLQNPIIKFILNAMFKDYITTFDNLKQVNKNTSLSQHAIILAEYENDSNIFLNHEIINQYYQWIEKYSIDQFPICFIEKNKIKIMLNRQINNEDQIKSFVDFCINIVKPLT